MGVAESSSSARKPALFYGLANFAFAAFLLFGVATHSGWIVSPPYLMVLFAICSSPLLVCKRLNDRFACYGMFLASYFVCFGLLDCVRLLSSVSPSRLIDSLMSESELLILVGALAFVLGYRWVAAKELSVERQALLADYSKSRLVLMGIVFWMFGTLATMYWTFVLTTRIADFHSDLSQFETAVLNVGRYSQPLGILMIAYAHARWRSVGLRFLALAVVGVGLVIGFAGDSKEAFMIAVILMVLTAVLVSSRIPKSWLASSAVIIIMGFPILQAHRTIVQFDRGMSNLQSLTHLGEALRLSWDNRDALNADYNVYQDEHAQSFFERASMKASVDMIVTRTGHGVPYQYGHTLMPLALAFVPRLLYADKEAVETGQLVNRAFNVTGNNVIYVSPSYLGELYWNFGWVGAVGGLLLMGVLLGFVNSRCDLSKGVSVTRVLIIGLAMYYLCARFEGSIAPLYSLWIRSVLGILLMHKLFAYEGPAIKSMADSKADTSVPAGAAPADVSLAPYPNLMR